jgi:hypothetical protein
MTETTLTHADKWEIIFRVLIPSLIGGLIIITAYFVYRWKIHHDQIEMQDLKSGHMKLKMEALAAEKKAERASRQPEHIITARPIEANKQECRQDNGLFDSFGPE